MEEATTKLLEVIIGFNEAHRQYNIPKPILQRHFKGLNKNVKLESFKDISLNLENQLVENVLNLESSFFRLTATDLRRLACQMAEKYKLPHRFNREKEIVEKKLYYEFMKDNPCLFLCTPEATSMARAWAFNKEYVNGFFDKYEIILNKYKFTSNQIFNVDKTGLSTVHPK